MESKIDNRPLYNSRIIDTYIKLIKRKYHYIDINELLSHAKMEPYQVEDEGHWFTQEQINLFYERLEKLTGNKNIAREAGRYAASPEASGVMRPYILGLVGPAKVYEIIGKAAPNFTKASVLQTKRLGAGKVEITNIPQKDVAERPFQCENRIGYFEAIATIFTYKLPKVEHPECMFKGEKSCRYIVSWKESPSDLWKNIRNYTALFLLAACIGAYFINPGTTLSALFPISVFAVLVMTIYAGTLKEKELNTAIDNLRNSSDKLLEQIDLNYNNVLMINEIGLALNKQADINAILANVVQILEKRLVYDRGLILLVNQDKTKLTFSAGFGYTDEQLNILRNASFRLDRPDSKGVFVVSFHEQKPFLINDITEIKETLSPYSQEFAEKMGVRSFICCPIIHEGESLGILAADNKITKRPFIQGDINLLMGIAPEIGISIHNAMLLEAKERQFKSLLQVLAASIDARDPLTAGHSERVTKYAVGICKVLGMPKEYCEMIRVASLLHDYGKIGIRDSILKKEGGLTFEEFKEIKTHVEKTRQILEQINFEGIFREVPEIAGSHHEKLDGSGYPKGLKEKEIPLGAMIIAVADFFEAITSKRHYRNPMPLNDAFHELMTKSDLHFDREVVEAFLRYYIKEYKHMPDSNITGEISTERFMSSA